MFFLYPYIKKVNGGRGKVGLVQEWRLFDIMAFKVGTFFRERPLIREWATVIAWNVAKWISKSCTWYKPEATNPNWIKVTQGRY